jgi:choline dehydrogenase
MSSGVGDFSVLKQYNEINLVHNLPGVGANLQEHPAVLLSYSLNKPTYNREFRGWRLFCNLIRWMFLKSGPLTTPVCQVGVYIKSSKDILYPDIQLDFTPFNVVANAQDFQCDKDYSIMMVPTLVRPYCRGMVLLNNRDIYGPPIIKHDYFSDPRDLDRLSQGVIAARKIMKNGVMSNLVEKEIGGAANLNDLSEIKEFVRQNTVCCWHPAGTCKMGVDSQSVVNEFLQIHGLSGIRIADASIMPTIVSANTTATCIMIGEKAADMILN